MAGENLPALRTEALLALPGKSAALALSQGNTDRALQLILDNPGASGQALAAAYYNPEIFLGLDTKIAVPDLSGLRSQFPSTLRHLTDERMVSLMRGFPYGEIAEARIQEEQSLLPPSAKITKGEIALRQLIMDGVLDQLDSEAYPRVFVSSELFAVLAESLQGNGTDSYEHIEFFEEDRRFVGIGNRLRKVVKLYTLEPESMDTDFPTSVVPAEDDHVAQVRRIREFTGKVAIIKQMRWLETLMGKKSEIPDHMERAALLRKHIQWHLERLTIDFPDKAGEIAEYFSMQVNARGRSSYVEGPGASYMSPAEVRNHPQ